MQDFVHLHVHTEYSLLDGACRIERAVKHVKSLGQSALAVTDHGVMFGVVDFYRACKAEGVKPIIGCEVYVAPRTRFDKVHKIDSSPYHLVLLCENNTGYQNLIKLVSAGFVEGFYSKPRIDLDILKEHSEGLVCLSACLAGEIPRLLANGEYDRAKEKALEYREIFGTDKYYIEIQDHGIALQRQILPQLVQLSRETGIGLVATNDAHYITKEDAKMQNVLICIQTNSTVDAPSDLEFETPEFYLKSYDEMHELFGAYAGALENTLKIADMCNVEFEFGNTKLPLFVAPDGQDNRAYFERLCMEGLHKYYGENPAPEVTDRLSYELDIISRMGYVDYFLIVYDFIRYAKSKGIPVGPGRGSGAGSLAAYCVGITGIDPIKYNLLFERFLNPERISMPDFDIDFCYERRQEVIDYVVEKYGYDHVAQIITFGTMAARGAIRDVGRALGMSYQQVDVIAKLVPFELKMTLDKALKVSGELRAMYEADEQVKRLLDMARKVEGMPRHASVHAAGVVITRDPVDSYVPLYRSDEAIVTQFPMTTLEELGLLKMDFLGLRTLTVISDAQKQIRLTEPDFDIEKIPLDDKDTFEMLTQGQCLGVFQFESGGMRNVLSQLHSNGFEDLIAVISLYRPGPMDSIPTYVRNRHNPELVTYKHPLLKPILDVTYGCIVYQEQVMQICRELGGYSYGRADLVRRAMSKKKHDVMEKERAIFIEGAGKNGVDAKTANAIFDEMSSFASYAFNKSHAAAYALVAYQTAYLKRHYPRAFMAALLTSVLDHTGRVTEYIAEANRMGIRVLQPDVNSSFEGFTADGDDIRFGLLAVKNIGRGVIRELIAEREKNGPFRDFFDFCERMYGKDMNKRALESFIKSGALDGLSGNRRQMLMGYDAILDDLDGQHKRNISGQITLFDDPGLKSAGPQYTLPQVEEYDSSQLLAMEKEITGLYISGHPMMQHEALAKSLKCVPIADITDAADRESGITDGQVVTVAAIVTGKRRKSTRSGDTMAFVTLEDISGSIVALVFPKILESNAHLLNEGEVILMKARVSMKDDDDTTLVVQSVATPQNPQELQNQNAYVRNANRIGVGQNAPSAPREPKQRSKNAGLYLRMQGSEDPAFDRVKNLLSIFDGAEPVYFYFLDTKTYNAAAREYWVQYNLVLDQELKKILGEENVVLKQ